MRKVSAALLGIAVCVIANSAMAAPSTATSANASCVAENRNAIVEWPAERAVSAARVYFRSANAKTEHYVDMRREGAHFYAVLPQVAKGTTAVQYRIASRDAKGSFATRTNGVITVSKSCAAKLTAAQAKAASVIVVGTAEAGLSAPIGFKCDGVIGTIDAKGKLHAQKPCANGAAGQLASNSPAQQENGTNGTQVTGTSAAKATGSAPSAIADEGPGLTPYHHRTTRRAPVTPTAPKPRLEPPVSVARP